jgi:single-strand DNA-binding protein
MAIYENYIRLKGFIGKQAQIKADSRGKQFAILSMCTKSYYRNALTDQLVTSTDWHRLVAFGALATKAESLIKGDYISVEGELRSAQYPTPDGKKRRVWEIRINSIEKLEAAPPG